MSFVSGTRFHRGVITILWLNIFENYSNAIVGHIICIERVRYDCQSNPQFLELCRLQCSVFTDVWVGAVCGPQKLWLNKRCQCASIIFYGRGAQTLIAVFIDIL